MLGVGKAAPAQFAQRANLRATRRVGQKAGWVLFRQVFQKLMEIRIVAPFQIGSLETHAFQGFLFLHAVS